jgi:carbon-monoxide dehydrogenase large subunit
MALDREGRIMAVRVRAKQNLGAYMVGAALVPLVYSLKLIPNVYKIPVVDLSTQGVFTHTAPTNPYRGAGRPEAIYVIERLLDLAAEELRIDPVEIRRRNFIEKAALPYKSATGLIYDSGDFRAAADACLSLADWNGFAVRRDASHSAGKLRGRAIVSYIEDTGVFNDRMELRFDPSGAVTIVAGTFSHGQSHATTYAQCVSDWLGIPMEQIRFIQGDTDQVAFGRGTYASGSAVIGGSALRATAEEIVRKAKIVAGHLLEASTDDMEFQDGNLRVAGTDREVSLCDVAKWTYHPARLPKHLRGRTGSERLFHRRAARLPQRLSHLRAGDRSRDRRRGDRPLHRGGRLRPPDQPADRERPSAWHGGARAGPGAERDHDLRWRRATPHRQLHGLRRAAGQPRAGLYARLQRRAVPDQSPGR